MPRFKTFERLLIKVKSPRVKLMRAQENEAFARSLSSDALRQTGRVGHLELSANDD
jgi:hypothetical protein